MLLVIFMSIGTINWIIFVSSYYCMGSSGIITHSIMQSPRVLMWDEVTEVRAECHAHKRARYGGLTVYFSRGQQIYVPLDSYSNVDTGDFHVIMSGLKPNSYSYVLSPSASQNTCPPQLYSTMLLYDSALR